MTEQDTIASLQANIGELTAEVAKLRGHTQSQPAELPKMALIVNYPDGSEVVYLADNAEFLHGLPWNSARWVCIRTIPSTPAQEPRA